MNLIKKKKRKEKKMKKLEIRERKTNQIIFSHLVNKSIQLWPMQHAMQNVMQKVFRNQKEEHVENKLSPEREKK